MKRICEECGAFKLKGVIFRIVIGELAKIICIERQA